MTVYRRLSKMRRRTAGRCAAVVLAAGLLVSAACAPTPAREHDSLDAQAQPLRERFNAAASSVRVLMIAAPT